MRKAVIVDFDGTLVDVNSFEEFCKRLFRHWLTGAGIPQAMYLAYLAAIRKMRLIEHAEMKRRVLLYAKERNAGQFAKRFAAHLCAKVNTKVVEIIQGYRNNGYAVLLCTAAPELYMEEFASVFNFGFDDMVCTETPCKDRVWRENSGIHKLETTRQVLQKRHEELAVLLTDSLDDMPLLCVEKEKNYWVNRSEHTAGRLEDAGIECEFI